MSLQERERKIDISKMSQESIDQLSVQIGSKITQICDEAAGRVNAILAIYGAGSAKIAIQFDGLQKKAEDTLKVPKKRGRKPKQNNLK